MLRMFLGALRMTSVGMWLRFGCLGVLLSCSPTEGSETMTDIALYLVAGVMVGLIWWLDRERMKRIADHFGEWLEEYFFARHRCLFLRTV